VSAGLAKAVVGLVAVILSLILLALVLVQTGWAKNRLRDLIVREANRYLAATLTVGRLDGSIFRGLQLGDISLDRNGHALVRLRNSPVGRTGKRAKRCSGASRSHLPHRSALPRP